jgi:hypothetical protein
MPRRKLPSPSDSTSRCCGRGADWREGFQKAQKDCRREMGLCFAFSKFPTTDQVDIDGDPTNWVF